MATAVLGASVFVVALAISRDLAEAIGTALVGASVGGAMGTLDYRRWRGIAAASRDGLRLWLQSAAWGTPLLALAWRSTPPLAGDPPTWTWSILGAAVVSAGMSLVSLVPLHWLHWLHGRWGNGAAP